jgi:hypothetical protein
MPRHQHDCQECVFLGRWGTYDLYYHGGGFETVIARYGSSGDDYQSGLNAARIPYPRNPLAVALRRATIRELLK